MRASVKADHEIVVARDEREHARIGAEVIGRAVVQAVEDRGIARVAISGGATPLPTYACVAALDLPFEHVTWFWVDERAVPPESPRSNYRTARGPLRIADGHHGRAERIVGEGEQESSRAAYESVLRSSFGVARAVAFDVMVLGVGEDGHVASLFPGRPEIHLEDRLVATVPAQPTKQLEARITLTAPVLLAARLSVVLVRGALKREAFRKAQTSDDPALVPASILRRAEGRVVWVADQEAVRS